MVLVAAVRHWLSVICINWAAVTIVVAHHSLSIDRASTARVTTDVGVIMARVAASRVGTLR